jgi:hypothetical protein
MSVWEGMNWWVKEGSGAGSQHRLVRMILGKPERHDLSRVTLSHQFLCSAAAAVTRFGPAWAKREICRRTVGVWLLVLCWLVPPAILALAAVHHGHGLARVALASDTRVMHRCLGAIGKRHEPVKGTP